MSTNVEHYLISLPLLPDGRNLHCYLMTTEGQDHMERACNTMIEAAEQFGGVLMPMFVSTGPLKPKYQKIVRDIISEIPEVKESLETATDYHITVFLSAVEDDARLMEIH